MDFSLFIASFGKPLPGTAVQPAALGLGHSKGLNEFYRQVGGGLFGNGLLSLVSVREQLGNLGGWESSLPEEIHLFGTSAFGLLMLSRGEDVWLVDTQMNDVFESEMPIDEFIIKLCDPEIREEHLRESLFQEWSRGVLTLDSKSILSPTPALALGGMWSREALSEMRLPEYLHFTAQLR